MKLETGKISGSQLFFLMNGFILSISLLFLPLASAQHLGWLSVLGAIVEGLIFVFLFRTLSLRFSGKNLIEINIIVFGRPLGIMVSLAYLWFFLHLASLNVRTIGDFFTIIFFVETPVIVFLLSIILTCAYAVKKGLEVIARCSQFLVPFAFFLIILDLFLLFKDMNVNYLLPLTDIPLKDLLESTHATAAILFGETVAFLMVFPAVNKQREINYSLTTVIVSGIIILTAVMRNIAILGPLISIASYPTLLTVRQIDVGEMLTRLEILIAIIFVTMNFLKVSVLYYSTVLGLAQICRLRSYYPLVLPIGALIICLSLLNYESSTVVFTFANEIYPFYSQPFELFLPLLTLIVAKIRKLSGKVGVREG